MPDFVLDAGDGIVHKIDKDLCPHRASILVGKKDSQQNGWNM